MLDRVRLAALMLLVCAAVSAPAQSAGAIAAVVPSTTVSRSSPKAPLVVQAVKGTPLVWRDTVKTGKSGRARILLNDQSVLSLGNDSRLRIVQHDARTQRTALELAYGRIRCQVSKITRSGGHFELRTPESVAGVIGTDFGADASIPGQTKYVCISGTVRIYTPDRRHYVDCTPGTSVTIVAGGRPSPPSGAAPYVLERWQHVTEPSDDKYAETLARQPDLADQPPAHPDEPTRLIPKDVPFEITADWRFRVEAWNWFASSANSDYAFAHSILHLGLGYRGARLDWQFQLAQPAVLGAPANSIAPGAQGQLGLGASYFAANGNSRNAAYVFPSGAYVRIHGLGRRESDSLTLGRFTFVDGLEVVSKNSTLAWLKRNRIAHRLIGNFGFSVTGRSADGADLSLDLGRTNITLAGARPTRGVFQVDGLGELDIAWQYGAVTLPFLHHENVGELRVFGIGYQDFRNVAKVDNGSPAIARSADINIATFGFNYLHALHTPRSGIFDFLVWIAGQAGAWGTQTHRAGAADAEVGWQPPFAWRPWLRAGYFIGSGDGNPSDARHNTFFPLLPTPRIYARFPFYNEMNNTDAFVMFILHPAPRLTLRSDLHALWLTSRRDLWYLGGGAFSPHAFGYVGRPSGGNRALANTWDWSAGVAISPHWAVNFYYAHAWAKDAVRYVYPQAHGADFGYTELLYKF